MSLISLLLVLLLTLANCQIQYTNVKANKPVFDKDTGVITLSEGLQTEQCLEQMRGKIDTQQYD